MIPLLIHILVGTEWSNEMEAIKYLSKHVKTLSNTNHKVGMFQHVALLNTTAKHALSLPQVVTKRQIRLSNVLLMNFSPSYSPTPKKPDLSKNSYLKM